MELAIGTRFFEKQNPERGQVIERFVRQARECAPRVLVAVNDAEDRSDALSRVSAQDLEGVSAFAVTPWGKFVQPLNALVLKACERGATHLLLASAEVTVTPEIVAALAAEMHDDTLVVGAAVVGHEFQPQSIVAGTGVKVPWNTLALWNLRRLAGLGFPLIGDAPFDPQQAGVEELCTISLYQRVYVQESRAVLLAVPGVQWDTANWDPDRLAAHQKKMASKVSRPAAQAAEADFQLPTVLHIRRA